MSESYVERKSGYLPSLQGIALAPDSYGPIRTVDLVYKTSQNVRKRISIPVPAMPWVFAVCNVISILLGDLVERYSCPGLEAVPVLSSIELWI